MQKDFKEIKVGDIFRLDTGNNQFVIIKVIDSSSISGFFRVEILLDTILNLDGRIVTFGEDFISKSWYKITKNEYLMEVL